jgi:hypothetical protein
MSHEIINQLRAPFNADRIEWRVGSCGEKQDGSIWARCLAYIDNRAAMERLDEVFGMNWSHSEAFHQVGGQAVCVVTISINNHAYGDAFLNRTVTGSCCVEANGDIDPFKSAASGAMKRAVVNLGIGRYLYDLPEGWAVIDANGKYDGKTKQGNRFRWNPPALPEWAQAGSTGAPAPVVEVRTVAPAPRPAAAPAKQTKATMVLPKEVDDVLDNATKVKVIARPHEGIPASAGSGADPVIPFGNNKGKTISQLSERDLDYWANKWEPRPWEKTGKVSPKDAALKDAAVALWNKTKGGAAKPAAPADIEVPAYEEPIDDIPF